MPDALLLLPVGLVVALAMLAYLVLRRSGVVAAESREAAGSRRALAELSARVDEALVPVIGRIDAVRRHQIEPAEIADDLATATEAVQSLADDARVLAVARGLLEVRAAVTVELERAGRALAMVEHGCGILADARPRGRELEAQTSIKRGYLNLLHAREAIERHARRASAWRSPRELRRDLRRLSG